MANVEQNSMRYGAESGTPRDSESGCDGSQLSIIDEMAQEHMDLERFKPSGHNTLHPFYYIALVYEICLV
jgi:hypothetical protein